MEIFTKTPNDSALHKTLSKIVELNYQFIGGEPEPTGRNTEIAIVTDLDDLKVLRQNPRWATKFSYYQTEFINSGMVALIYRTS